MRTKKSFINMIVGVAVQIEIAIAGIIARRIFIHYLSLEYLGSHSVFANVLTVLSFATCGASAVSYIGIKAFATKKEQEISKAFRIIHLYNWVSTALLAGVGLIAGLFLPRFLNNATSFSWDFLTAVYYLYLMDVCISTWSGLSGTPGYYDCMIRISQNQAICSAYNFIVTNVYLVLQCIVLIIKRDYLLYLLVSVLSKVLYIVLTRSYCFRHFPYLKKKVSVSRDEIKRVRLLDEIKNNFAIMLASVVFHGTDSMVITAGVGITTAALFSNYTTFQNQLLGIVNKFVNGMNMSVADYLYNTQDESSKKILFYRIQFLCGVVALVCAVCFFNLVQPFITLFFGEGLLLETVVACGVSVLVFSSAFSNSLSMFRHAKGQYWLDRNYHILSAVSNLLVSLALVRIWGVVGVLIGTVLGNLFSIQGYLVVTCGEAVTSLKRIEWWEHFLLWSIVLGAELLISAIGIARMPFTVLYVFIRGGCSVLLSVAGVIVICGLSKTARTSVKFYYDLARQKINWVRNTRG